MGQRRGVGPTTARMWYLNGCRTLEDAKRLIKLSTVQEIGLRYYDGAYWLMLVYYAPIPERRVFLKNEDINTRIPRAEVQEIFSLVKAEGTQEIGHESPFPL